ncbi:MAG: succinyl-CoA--3-ketoacid-CoA transferase, partial [Hafniaceae bacterium]|nr:succinyl-CoA--3-ketoacid-CoA transferase [Hafniaceae bacterium]
RCTLPLTAKNCVDMIVTELAVFVLSQGELVLKEHAPGVTLQTIQQKTAAAFRVAPDLSVMPISVDGAQV